MFPRHPAGRVRLLVLSACLAALLVLPASSSAAPPVGGKAYVALGDSYSSGPGLDPTREAGCGRSQVNYASRVAGAFGLGAERRGRWADYSCAGASATTSAGTPISVLDQIGWAVGDRALGPATRTVTFTAGGNDGWVGKDHDTLYAVLTECIRAGTPCGPARRAGPIAQILPEFLTSLLPSGVMRLVASVLAGDDEQGRWLSPADLTPARMTAKLRPAVTAIRARAKNATIAIVGYPRVVPAAGSPGCAGPLGLGWALDPDEIVYLDGLLAAYDRAQRAAVGDLNGTVGPVEYVDLRTPSTGHDLCAGGQGWVNAPILAGLGFLGDSLHPSIQGMDQIADAVEAVASAAGLRRR